MFQITVVASLAVFLIGLASGNVVDFDNCELLGQSLKMAWTINTAAGTVDFLVCGCLLPEQRDEGSNQYMGVGLSASPDRVNMMEADAVIAWIDQMIVPHAEDYYLSGRFQCRGGDGVCADEVYGGASCSNDVTAIDGYVEDAQQCVTFSRPINATDTCDRAFNLNEAQYIVWAVGGIEESAFKHFTRAEPTDPPLEWTRDPPEQNCQGGLQCAACPGFENLKMESMESTTFIASIGPTGNERGYMSITGRAGWGIAWYLNGILIPELVVRRGNTYTFSVEGGNNPTNTGSYHPFYITNSRNGGRLLNTESQQAAEVVYAGFTIDNIPEGVGPYCEYTDTDESRGLLSACGNRELYNAALGYSCASERDGVRGTFTWTPDSDTPDTVYYQCATHRNLGWRIKVMDAGAIGTSVKVLVLATLLSVIAALLVT